MHLSDAQLRHFHTFGYLGIPRVFSAEEIGSITDEFESSIANNGGSKHTGSNRTMFLAAIEYSAKQAALLDDPRVTGILGSILGDDFNYCSGDGNYYTGDTSWHPDGNWGRLFAIKLAFYLDPVSRDTGCLRVIPGSHDPQHFLRRPLSGTNQKINMNGSLAQFGVPPRDFPGNVALETQPGDLLVFNHDTFHAAFGGGTRRRMFTMNCTIRAKTPEDKQTLTTYLKSHSPGAYKYITGAGMYTPTMLDTASPARMVQLQQAREIHDELFPQYRRG